MSFVGTAVDPVQIQYGCQKRVPDKPRSAENRGGCGSGRARGKPGGAGDRGSIEAWAEQPSRLKANACQTELGASPEVQGTAAVLMLGRASKPSSSGCEQPLLFLKEQSSDKKHLLRGVRGCRPYICHAHGDCQEAVAVSLLMWSPPGGKSTSQIELSSETSKS